MKTELMQRLQTNAEWMNDVLSKVKAANPTGLTFSLEQVRSLSEDAGASIHIKPDGRRAVVFWYFTNTHSQEYPNGHWDYIIPTDTHMYGMAKLAELKEKIEAANFKASVVVGLHEADPEEYPE